MRSVDSFNQSIVDGIGHTESGISSGVDYTQPFERIISNVDSSPTQSSNSWIQNPLEQPRKFQLTLANPNPKSSKTKDGPIYRVSFELTQDEWQWFMDTETAGMVLECDCIVTHSNNNKDQNYQG